MARRSGNLVDTRIGATRRKAQAGPIEALRAFDAPTENPAALYTTTDQCVPV